jgi:hypothetical protein
MPLSSSCPKRHQINPALVMPLAAIQVSISLPTRADQSFLLM